MFEFANAPSNGTNSNKRILKKQTYARARLTARVNDLSDEIYVDDD